MSAYEIRSRGLARGPDVLAALDRGARVVSPVTVRADRGGARRRSSVWGIVEPGAPLEDFGPRGTRVPVRSVKRLLRLGIVRLVEDGREIEKVET